MGVRRGSGVPVTVGRGVCTGDGVKTMLGATRGTAGLNGVGSASSTGGVRTYTMCVCAS